MSKYKRFNECKDRDCKNPVWKNADCKKHWEGKRDFPRRLVPESARAHGGDMGV